MRLGLARVWCGEGLQTKVGVDRFRVASQRGVRGQKLTNRLRNYQKIC